MYIWRGFLETLMKPLTCPYAQFSCLRKDGDHMFHCALQSNIGYNQTLASKNILKYRITVSYFKSLPLHQQLIPNSFPLYHVLTVRKNSCFSRAKNSNNLGKIHIYCWFLSPIYYGTNMDVRFNRFYFMFNSELFIFYWITYFMTSKPRTKRRFCLVRVPTESDKYRTYIGYILGCSVAPMI